MSDGSESDKLQPVTNMLQFVSNRLLTPSRFEKVENLEHLLSRFRCDTCYNTSWRYHPDTRYSKAVANL